MSKAHNKKRLPYIFLTLFSLLLFLVFVEPALSAKQRIDLSDEDLNALAKQVYAGQISEALANKLSNHISKNPKDGQAYFLLAELYQNAGFQDLAAQLLDQYEKFLPGAFLEAYRQAVYTENNAFADKYLVYAQQRYPFDASVLLMNARGLSMHKRFREVHEMLASIIYYRSRIPGLCKLLAEVCLQEGRYDEALHYAELELKRNPDDIQSQTIRLQAMNELGFNLINEQSFLKKLYDADQTEIDIGILYARNLVAAQQYRTALEPALFGVWCFSSQQTNKQNMQTLRYLLRLIPPQELALSLNSFITHYKIDPMLVAMIDLKLGQIYKDLGNNEAAVKHLEKSLNATPFFRKTLYGQLAPLMILSKDYQKAANYYQQAFQADPANREARQQYNAFLWGYRRQLWREKNPDLAARIKSWMHRCAS